MHMVLVIAVRARTQHGHEARAHALPQAVAKLLGDLRVGELHHLAVGELQRADIERIALAVLGELGAHDPVAAAAIEGGEIGDAP